MYKKLKYAVLVNLGQLFCASLIHFTRLLWEWNGEQSTPNLQRWLALSGIQYIEIDYKRRCVCHALERNYQIPASAKCFWHPIAIHFKEALIVKQAISKGLENVIWFFTVTFINSLLPWQLLANIPWKTAGLCQKSHIIIFRLTETQLTVATSLCSSSPVHAF